MSKVESILKRLSNNQMLHLEKIIPVKYREVVEEIRLREYFRKMNYNALDVYGREVCYIEKGAWDFQLFNVAFINNMLANIIYCLSKGFLPEIRIYDKNGVNLWEQFLRQPFSKELNTIKKSKGEITRCDVEFANFYFPKFPTEEEVIQISKLYKRFIVFNDKTLQYFKDEYCMLLKEKRVLGVLCRGTDYTSNKPVGHPIQPKVKDVIEFIKEKNKILKCEYIYLATEEEKIYQMFEEAFPGQIIINKRQYYDEFYEIKNKFGDEARISWVHNDRENDNYYKSLEYLSSVFLLSKCNALIGGSCGGTQAAIYMNGNQYEYKYLFDLGLY